jgi:hypothetical protein
VLRRYPGEFAYDEVGWVARSTFNALVSMAKEPGRRAICIDRLRQLVQDPLFKDHLHMPRYMNAIVRLEDEERADNDDTDPAITAPRVTVRA